MLRVLGVPKPHSTQQKLIMQAFRSKNLVHMCVANGTKFGKAQPLSSVIPTPSGYKTMGDISVGDYVFTEHGAPTQVLSVTDVMEGRECFEVVFSDGQKVRCDADHDWVTLTHYERKNLVRGLGDKWLPKKRTTRELLETLKINIGDKQRPNHSVDVMYSPANFVGNDLPIHPYVLGVWLGDGSSHGATISKPSEPLKQAIASLGESVGDWHKDGISFTVFGLLNRLKSLNLIQNKHIPEMFLISSIADRLALVQGLMDTDGTISKRGDCTFDNTNQAIVVGIEKVLWSLGIKTTRTQRYGKLNNQIKKLCYRVHFTPHLRVFRDPFKSSRLRIPSKKAFERKIVEINPIPSEPVKCITVDNPSSLYCTGYGFVPTHNSISAAAAITLAAWTKRNGMYRWVAPLYTQSKIGMRYVEKMLPQDREFWKPNNADMALHLLHQKTIIEFWHGSNAEGLEGEGVNGYIFDEAAKMKANVFPSAKTTTTVTKGPIIEISTPNGKNHFYERCMECKAEMEYSLARNNVPKKIFLTAPSYVNPMVTKEVIEEAQKALPERLFRQYYLAEFVEDGSVFSNIRKMVEGEEIRFSGRQQTWISDDAERANVVIGVDWAKMQDYTVFFAFDVSKAKPRCVGFSRFQNVQYIQAIRSLVEFSEHFESVQIIYHDRTGVGEALDELLQGVSLPFHGVTLTNQNKTEMISNLIFACEQVGMILPHWPAMITELDSFEVTHTTTGLLKYAAPTGFHDDIVIAIMLAYAAMQENKISTEILTLDDLEKKGPSQKSWYDQLTTDEDDEY